jgi:hypothetical protein
LIGLRQKFHISKMVRKFLGAEPPLAQNPGSATGSSILSYF